MLPWPTGLQKRHLASSEALCRSATCQHNRVTSREFQGLTFCSPGFAEMSMRRAGLRRSSLPSRMGQQGSDDPSWPSQVCWPSDELWPNLLSRSADRSVLGRRDHVRQRGRTVDGFDDLIGGEVVDHVTETGKNGQLALGDLRV